jgi:hypothetical protein
VRVSRWSSTGNAAALPNRSPAPLDAERVDIRPPVVGAQI